MSNEPDQRSRFGEPEPEESGELRVAVVGAGVAGVSAARRLSQLGHGVRVFDKGRGVGGRCATRRSNGLRFDHGAQFFTARQGPFIEALGPLIEMGHVQEWRPRIARLGPDGHRSRSPDSVRYVGVPGMSVLGKGLAGDLDVEQGAHVRSLERQLDGTWMLTLDGERHAGPFMAVIVACPAPQAAELLRTAHPGLASACDGVRLLPCWSVMAAFDRPLHLDLDAAFIDDEVLAWMARDSGKPGRASTLECWTLHAGPAWSARHLEEEPEVVAETVLDRFGRLVGEPLERPVHLAAHRWRYARTEQPANPVARWIDADSRIAVAGDWQLGDRIEDAFMSGRTVASELARAIDSAS